MKIRTLFRMVERAALILGICAVTAPLLHAAERTVKGRVIDVDGNPIQGAKVRAWDDDSPGNDDFMGEALTNASGDYSLSYHGGHWDPYPHNITKWRPDIYVNVLLSYGGEWVRVYRSDIHEDWKLHNDLTINVRLLEHDRWVERKTSFDPVIHGWPFANDKFKVCAAPTCKEENWAGQYLRSVLRFNWALCGGMSLSALHRFKNSKPVEPFSPKVKEELVKAQIETLAPENWAAFIEMQRRPTQPHTMGQHTIGEATKTAWFLLTPRLDAGKPTVLGLIRIQSKNPLKVGDNHQVLAIGYRYNELYRAAEVDVYDPNYPKLTSTLYFNLGVPKNQINAVQKTPGYSNDVVRGFFVLLGPTALPGLE